MTTNDAGTKTAGLANLRKATKIVVGPVARTLWPLIEQSASMLYRVRPSRRDLNIAWADTWTDRFDKALDLFAPPPGCTMAQYRALVQPTDCAKRHALVLEAGTPAALISLRRRTNFWEPVAYQVISGFIAPARDRKTLGHALNALGVDFRIEAGLSDSVLEMEPTYAYPYDFNIVDLESDYETFWKLNDGKHHTHVSIARKKCKKMHMVVNDMNDIEWIVNTWRDCWTDAPEKEIVAAPDRIRFWNTLNTSSEDPGELTVQTYTLYLGDARVAGIVTTCINGTQTMQCIAQLPEFRRYGTGTRIQDMMLEHSARAGIGRVDLGGGPLYKSYWGPKGGKRYGAGFRPDLLSRLRWVHHH